MNAIPNDLRTLPQWVAWKRETRNDKETKVPISPITGRGASSTDESTWSSYEHACAYVRENRLAGIGFMFKKDGGYVGIDLDHVRNLETGELEEWARDIVAILDSYTEISQSGTGLHIICKGALPGDKRRKGQVEMYDQGRYFVMTGIPLDDTSLDIQERQDELALIYEEFLAEKDPPAALESETPRTPIALDDTELVQRAMEAGNGAKFAQLWAGSRQGYASQSEADLALCCMLAFWTGKNAEQIDRLFRQSELMRDKWDEQHGKDTYGQLTIKEALHRTTETYNPSLIPNFPANPATTDPSTIADEIRKLELCTDLGNTKRWVRMFGQDFRYCARMGGWYIWRDGYWQRDFIGRIYRRICDSAEAICLDAAQETNKAKQKELVRWAKSSQNKDRIKAVEFLGQFQRGIATNIDDWDTNPWLLNCKNGTLDLRTGELREHRRDDLITKMVKAEYNPDATDEKWNRYLEHITNGDAEFQRYLQKAVGYSLTGCTREEVFFLMLGPAATGKSTLIESIGHLLGNYAVTASFDTFLSKKTNGGPTPDIAMLSGARFVSAVETAKDRKLAEPLLKGLTGGDTVTARHLWQEYFSFAPQCKIWLAANEAPKISDTDSGIWRRLQRLPVERTIPEEQKDLTLKEYLRDNALPAILAWAVKGCLLWQQEGLKPPAVILEKTSDLRADMNPLGEFLQSYCAISPHTQVEALVLRQAYEEWAKENGAYPISAKEWGERLRQVGAEQIRIKRNGRKMTIWQGIGLRGDDDQEDLDKGTGGHSETWQNPIVSVQKQFSMDTGDTEKSVSTENIGKMLCPAMSLCPPEEPPEPEKPKWKPQPGDLVRRRDGFRNLMGGGPWRVVSLHKTERIGIEYARIEREGDDTCDWIIGSLEPWEPPQEKSADEDAEWF